MAGFVAVANQTAKEMDLNGTWASDDGTTLVITQQGPEIKIKETRVQKGKTSISESTYFADARGETNPSASGKDELMSVTKWSGDVLIVKYSLSQTRNDKYPLKNERIDGWGISRDGKKLTHTSSMTTWPARLDPSSNPGAAPRGLAALSAPISWKQKRTFKKIA